MIRYTLVCAKDHSFDSWFQSAEAFDKLRGAGMVACTTCQSTDVTKSLMAPAVRPARKAGEAPARPLADPGSETEAVLSKLRKHVEQNSDYVGSDFATQARAMHEGSAPERAIHGEARLDEARALLEEGVPIAPLPFLPGRKTN
jgi:hypothetical protein